MMMTGIEINDQRTLREATLFGLAAERLEAARRMDDAGEDSPLARAGQIPLLERMVSFELDLSGINASRVNLSDANLRDANLTNVDFRGANLQGAILTEADLTEADLTEADLRNADLRAATLAGADLSSADLGDAQDLTQAQLDSACGGMPRALPDGLKWQSGQCYADPGGCPANAEIWRELAVCEEQPRDGYDRNAFGSGYSSMEDEIILALPATMQPDGQVYTPYSCTLFDLTAAGTAATDIEHIVALAEAHDSRIADDRRLDFARDVDNLTISAPQVNRFQKADRDAGEWVPARNGAWFAERVIQVKRKYGLSVDAAERDGLEMLLAGGGAALSCP